MADLERVMPRSNPLIGKINRPKVSPKAFCGLSSTRSNTKVVTYQVGDRWTKPPSNFSRHLPNRKKERAVSTDFLRPKSKSRKSNGHNIGKYLPISSPMKGEKNMHMDPLIEVQNQKPRTTLRVERLLREAEALSPEERLQFFPRWMERQDVRTRVALFVAWMRTEKDDKLKMTLFVSWMKLESGNEKLLRDIVVKATAVSVTKGFTKRDYSEIERWIEAAVEK